MQGAISTAAACSITVTGCKASSTKTVTTQVFLFTPAEEVIPPTFGTFEGAFRNLNVFVPAGLNITAVNLVVDDFGGVHAVVSWDRVKLVEHGNRRDRILFMNFNSALYFMMAPYLFKFSTL